MRSGKLGKILFLAIFGMTAMDLVVFHVLRPPLPAWRLFGHALWYKSPDNPGWLGSQYDAGLKPAAEWPRRIVVWRLVFDPLHVEFRPVEELYDPRKHTPGGATPVTYEEIQSLYNTTPQSAIAPVHAYRGLGWRSLPDWDFRRVLAEHLQRKGWSSEQSRFFLIGRGPTSLREAFRSIEDPFYIGESEGPAPSGSLYDIRNDAFSMISVWRAFGAAGLAACGLILIVSISAAPRRIQQHRIFIGSAFLAAGLLTALVIYW